MLRGVGIEEGRKVRGMRTDASVGRSGWVEEGWERVVGVGKK